MTMTQTSPCCWDSAPAPSLLGFSRPFVAFLGGSLVSRIGDALYTFALPWMAYELTHSSLVLGTIYATEIVPVLLFGAFAGVYVDRLNRRRLLLGADLLRAALVTLIPLLSLLGFLQIWELYALAFSLALLSLASDIATTAVLPELAQSENTRANAAYQFIMRAAEFGGPAIAGLAIAALGGVHTLWLDALSLWWNLSGDLAFAEFRGTGPQRSGQACALRAEGRLALALERTGHQDAELASHAGQSGTRDGQRSLTLLSARPASTSGSTRRIGLCYGRCGWTPGKFTDCAVDTPVAPGNALSSAAVVRTHRARFACSFALVVGTWIEPGNSCRLRYGLDHPQYISPPGAHPCTTDG